MDQWRFLDTHLLDLVHALRHSDLPIMVGGGYGLYRKWLHVRETGRRTLFATVPDARSTNDLDILLRADVLASNAMFGRLRAALDALGYSALARARFFQFEKTVRQGGVSRSVRVDLLGALGDEGRARVHVSGVRVRPKAGNEPAAALHAFLTNDAIGLSESPLSVVIDGRLSSGEPFAGNILLPPAFSYLVMKLHAYHDQRDDAGKGSGARHASDLYGILAMMTEPEYEAAKRMGVKYSGDRHVRQAAAYVAQDFSAADSRGVSRILEQSRPSGMPEVPLFISVLGELFAPASGQAPSAS